MQLQRHDAPRFWSSRCSFLVGAWSSSPTALVLELAAAWFCSAPCAKPDGGWAVRCLPRSPCPRLLFPAPYSDPEQPWLSPEARLLFRVFPVGVW